MSDAGAFDGFSEWAVRFYRDLEENNTRDFWQAHKEQWEREVRDPMLALVGALEADFGPAVVFRPYRDVRFSRDKSPYKTHLGAIAGPAAGIGYYVQLDGTGLTVGGGFHTHSPAQTDRYREAVADERTGAELEGVVAQLVADGFGVEGAALKTRPKGYDADHPRMELLRRKEIMGIKRVGTPEWLHSPAALGEVRSSWEQIRPLASWIIDNVGPSAETDRRAPVRR
jgi:uncharacterized protein (TIGR02453 family)